MVLSGKKVIEEEYVRFPNDGQIFDHDSQIQPNGIDMRVLEVFNVNGSATLGRDKPMDFTDIRATKLQWKQGWINLVPGGNYVVNFREEITVPSHYCAIIKPRSSMLRVGAFVTSALWDAGFTGALGAVVRPLNEVKIEYGARLAQVMFLEAEEGQLYDGRYQGTTSQTALMSNG